MVRDAYLQLSLNASCALCTNTAQPLSSIETPWQERIDKTGHAIKVRHSY